jgi:hypothetical protein
LTTRNLRLPNIRWSETRPKITQNSRLPDITWSKIRPDPDPNDSKSEMTWATNNSKPNLNWPETRKKSNIVRPKIWPDPDLIDPNLIRDPIIFLVKFTRPNPSKSEPDPTRPITTSNRACADSVHSWHVKPNFYFVFCYLLFVRLCSYFIFFFLVFFSTNFPSLY